MRAHKRNARASPACDIPRYVRSQHRFTKKKKYEKKWNPRKSARKAKNPQVAFSTVGSEVGRSGQKMKRIMEIT